jgi:3-oxoacyl-[acyl-carrier protein] reductase
MSNLKNKVALITGSARGIGKAIAERYGSLGASVVVNYVSSERPAQETVAAIKRLGGAATAIQADVSKVADIDRLFANTIEHYGSTRATPTTPPVMPGSMSGWALKSAGRVWTSPTSPPQCAPIAGLPSAATPWTQRPCAACATAAAARNGSHRTRRRVRPATIVGIRCRISRMT